MLPRIDTADHNFTAYYNSATLTTQVSWQAMTGGECIILQIDSVTNYYKTHRYCYFDEDDLADINYRMHDSNETWIMDYAANGFGTIDASNQEYGNTTNSQVTSGDYNGDGITEISVLYNSSNSCSLLIEESLFSGWNRAIDINATSSNITPFIGDFNGDGKYDFFYRNESEERLYKRYANQFILESDTLGQYGNNTYTIPAVGDYDGDGKDDLALVKSNGNVLVDFNYNGLTGWDVTNYQLPWNNISPANSITVVSDYDGDGKADIGLFWRDTKTWNIDLSYNGFGVQDNTLSLTSSIGNISV